MLNPLNEVGSPRLCTELPRRSLISSSHSGAPFRWGLPACLCLLLALGPAAQAQDQSAAEAGKKLSDPLSDIWALFTEVDYSWSEGDFTNGQWRTGQSIIFQPIMPISFSENWKMLMRPTLPIIVSADIPDGRRHDTLPIDDGTVLVRPDGSASFSKFDGLGDLSLPLLFTPKPKPGAKWGFGAGPTFVFPTGTEDELTKDTWEIGPAAVVTYKSGNFTGAALAQYWWNYAEDGNNTPDTSHGSLLYMGWWDLGNAWQIGFNPTITYNNETASNDKWNVPIGLGVAKTIMWGNVPIKFQLSVEKSIVRQHDYGTDWKVRLNIIPVIPSLIKKPLF